MTKEQLQRYRAIVYERQQVALELEELRAMLYGVTSPQITGLPGSSVRRRSAVETNVTEHTEELQALEAYYMELGAKLAQQQLAIEKAIDSLEPLQRTIMRHRYINGMKWEEICVAIGYEWRQTHRLHRAALAELRGGTHD